MATGFDVQGGNQQISRWSSGLFDCFDDVSNCCITLWFPCITFGQMAHIVDRGETSCGANGALYTVLYLLGIPCIYSCVYRTKLRKQYGLSSGNCGDFLVHCCCEQCALCQEYRELKHRGYDMDLGWQGRNVNQVGNQTVPPLAQPGMAR